MRISDWSSDVCSSDLGTGIVKTKGDYPTWTLGLDYQATRDLFLYITSCGGIRGVNVNTPLFETPFTTGAIGACLGVVNCPDLPPFHMADQEQVTDVETGNKNKWREVDVSDHLNISSYQPQNEKS